MLKRRVVAPIGICPGSGFPRGMSAGLRPLSPGLLIGAVAAYAILFWSTDGFTAPRPTTLRHPLHALLQACEGFWMTLWCLLAAGRWLAGRSASMRWLADASYWVYLTCH